MLIHDWYTVTRHCLDWSHFIIVIRTFLKRDIIVLLRPKPFNYLCGLKCRNIFPYMFKSNSKSAPQTTLSYFIMCNTMYHKYNVLLVHFKSKNQKHRRSEVHDSDCGQRCGASKKHILFQHNYLHKTIKIMPKWGNKLRKGIILWRSHNSTCFQTLV